MRRLRPFLGFKILNFNIFWGFYKNEYFFFGGGGGGGKEDFVDIFFFLGGGGSSQNWTILRGRFHAFRVFS